MPKSDADQALIRIEASAICGSEKPALQQGMPTNAGHEAAGVIDWAPQGCGFSVGERVGISAISGCGECEVCRAGVEIYCREVSVQIGMHAEFYAAPVLTLRKLPDGIDAALAAVLTGDAFGVPVRALRRVPSGPGTRVAVLGLGPVGLSHVLVRAFKGAEVIGVDPVKARRDLARELGAAAVLEPGEDLSPSPSIIIEASGIASSIQFALDQVAPGGTVLQSGECQLVEIKPSDTFIRREVTYTGSWYYATEDYPEMIRLFDEGLPIGNLITHTFPAARAQEAFDTFVSGSSGKVLLDWT